MIYFRPRGSFSANFCPMFIAFPQLKIQSAIDRLLPTPPTNVKCLEATKFLLIPGYVLSRGLA